MNVYNCEFTAPTAGQTAPIVSYGGFLGVYGNCQYSGAISVGSIFAAFSSGFLALGFADDIETLNLIFNIAGTPSVTRSTAIAIGGGVIQIYENAATFTGGIPTCAQYEARSGGGIIFSTGITTIFPGTLPGVVIAPGWTDV